jgi:hypothetical protein
MHSEYEDQHMSIILTYASDGNGDRSKWISNYFSMACTCLLSAGVHNGWLD